MRLIIPLPAVSGVLWGMQSENSIRLSGPFIITDSLGRHWELEGIRIFDEGYGIIDVFVDFMHSMDDEPLYQDALVIRQIIARLRTLGYGGPDFGIGDPGLQDERLIVLEAPEEFGRFAAGYGWKNLAELYADDPDADLAAGDGHIDAASLEVFDALMQRLRAKS